MAFSFPFNLFRRGGPPALLSRNLIDAAVMSRFVGGRVSKGGFHLEEDMSRALAPGVTWRRRRFRFRMVDGDQADSARVGLCINEITIDSNAEAGFRPVLAAEIPHLVDFDEIENAYWQTVWASGALRDQRGVKETRLFLNTTDLVYGSPQHRDAMLDALRRTQSLENYDEEAAQAAADMNPVLFESMPPGRFAVARYLPAFPPSRLVQSSENILAATNAGYFLNFPEEYDDGVSSLHQPVGGQMADGRLLVPPWLERPGLLGFENGGIKAALFGPADLVLMDGQGTELPLVPFPRRSGTTLDGVVVRRHDPFQQTLPPSVAQLHFCGSILVRVATGPTLEPPPFGGACVLVDGEWATKAMAPDKPAGLGVKLRNFTEGSPRWMICSGPFLVHKNKAIAAGEILKPANAGEFRPDGPAPTRFPYDADTTKAPRTAVGVLPSGGTKIVVVDGRMSREHSVGVDLVGMAAIMERMGCETAINLDGGGSSVLAVEGIEFTDMLQEHLPLGVVNIPSDDGGRERIVPIILAVQATNRDS